MPYFWTDRSQWDSMFAFQLPIFFDDHVKPFVRHGIPGYLAQGNLLSPSLPHTHHQHGTTFPFGAGLLFSATTIPLFTPLHAHALTFSYASSLQFKPPRRPRPQ